MKKTATKKILQKIPGKIGDDNFRLFSSYQIAVPTDFDSMAPLAAFRESHKDDFAFYQGNIDDQNFSTTTDRLEPGQTYVFKLFESARIYDSEEALEFYKRQGALLVGKEAYVIGWTWLKDIMPEGRSVASFDKESALFKTKGRARMALMEHRFGGTWSFFIGHFTTDWSKKVFLLLVFENGG